jgi:hypothetical protein
VGRSHLNFLFTGEVDHPRGVAASGDTIAVSEWDYGASRVSLFAAVRCVPVLCGALRPFRLRSPPPSREHVFGHGPRGVGTPRAPGARFGGLSRGCIGQRTTLLRSGYALCD